MRRERVVVIGGGFGGLNVVRALDGADVDVTVLDLTNHHLFQPLLYQVATGILPPGLIAPALCSVIKEQDNARALLADVHDIDLERKVVHANAAEGHPLDLPYDTLVVAAGATHSYFGNDRFAEFAPGMKTVEDARYLRDGILLKFEMAEVTIDPQERAEWLTFVVIGPARPAWSWSARSPSWRTACCRATTGPSTPRMRGSSCWRARTPCRPGPSSPAHTDRVRRPGLCGVARGVAVHPDRAG